MASKRSAGPDDEDAAVGGVAKARSPFAPLLVATVGLPGRGKSLLARRLARHLTYNGEPTRVFDISEYRRRHMEKYASHEMFRADNEPARRLREQSVLEAMEDAAEWLSSGNPVAILDGPNVSRAQRERIFDRFGRKLGYRVAFLEFVCDDPQLLEDSFKDILQYSADYRDMPPEEALTDLTQKMAHYVAQYEPPQPGSKDELPVCIVKLLDGCHGGLVAHGAASPREARLMAFVSVPRPAHHTFYLSRHGESEYNYLGRIGGDAPLSPRGKKYARALGKFINGLGLANLQVWTSQLHRTKATANPIQAPKLHLAELNEIASGECEGLSYEELQERYPREFASRDSDKLNNRFPGGENYRDVMRRLGPVLDQLEASERPILIVSHQAVLRCVLGYFLETPIEEIPYVRVPLHTVIKLTLKGRSYAVETVEMPIECVDTTRLRPQNCTNGRTSDEALATVPAHLDALTY